MLLHVVRYNYVSICPIRTNFPYQFRFSKVIEYLQQSAAVVEICDGILNKVTDEVNLKIGTCDGIVDMI